MKARSSLWVIAMLLASACVALAAKPSDTTLGKCLPTSGEISGWKVTANSYDYGSGNGIADIYNGGYEKLVEKGMKAACMQTYTNDSRRVNVYCDEFENASKAKAFFDDETDGDGWTTVAGVKTKGKYKKSASVVVGHLYFGKVHAKVVAQGTSDAQVTAAKDFLKKLSERIDKNY